MFENPLRGAPDPQSPKTPQQQKIIQNSKNLRLSPKVNVISPKLNVISPKSKRYFPKSKRYLPKSKH